MINKITILVSVAVVLGAAVFIFTRNRQTTSVAPVVTQTQVIPAEQNLKTDIQPVTNPDMPTQTHTVTIQGFAFSPANLTINQGDTVVWVNKDSTAHTISGDGFASSNLSNGQDYNFKFTKVGAFNYHCSIHPSMKGTVIVK